MNIAMWSGPRNLSTALMYSFAARGDCTVRDEPFYAAYLAATGIDHPMRDVVIAAGERDPGTVAAACAARVPGEMPLVYQKHMTVHMVAGFPLDFMAECRNVFLIRHPARVVASYVKMRQNPTAEELGFQRQKALFDREAERLSSAPPVIDSADIRANPRRTLGALCAVLGIPFTERMLSWPTGPRPFDGVWAPHWYGAVHRSGGFEPPEGDLPDLDAEHAALAGVGLPSYEALRAHAL